MLTINGYPFGKDLFRNGEAIFKKTHLEEFDMVTVGMTFENNKDIGDLIFANQYLSKFAGDKEKILFMKYIPYSRMDRPIDDQLFSLEMFAGVINAMNFSKVYAYDPHSPESKKQINNLVVCSIGSFIRQVIKEYKPDLIFFPDKGAHDRYPEMLKLDQLMIPYIYGEKKRDLANRGHIKEFKVISGDMDLNGKRVLIVDDICTFGGTFYAAASALREAGAADVALWVTHCEDTIFDGKLIDTDLVSNIYTTDSLIRSRSSEKLHVYEANIKEEIYK